MFANDLSIKMNNNSVGSSIHSRFDGDYNVFNPAGDKQHGVIVRNSNCFAMATRETDYEPTGKFGITFAHDIARYFGCIITSGRIGCTYAHQ